MSSFPRAVLQAGAQEFGVHLSEAQLNQFERYAALLAAWNERMNLTRIPAEQTATHHFLDSLSIASVCHPSGRLLDVGTGAGFPGVALKIAYPELSLSVLDSVKKKLSFIEAVSQELKLSVHCIGERAEVAAHDPSHRAGYDFVTSRAVAELSQLASWTLPFAKLGGRCVAMKGPGAQTELAAAEAAIQALGGRIAAVKSVNIPATNLTHSLIIIDKISETPAALPKRGNVKKR